MFVAGDPVAPVYNGELFTHKPPWLYWGIMLGYELFGCNEFAARCGSALAGLATVLVTYAIGRRLFSARVGFWGGVILGVCLQFSLIARAATPDAWLTLFCTLGTVMFARGVAPGARLTTSTYALAYAFLGLGILVKGPVAIVLPVASWAVFLVSREVLLVSTETARLRHAASNGAESSATAPRSRLARFASLLAAMTSPRRWLRVGLAMRPDLALLATLVIAGPWYALVGYRTDGAWLVGFFGVHNFGRFMQPMENHGGPIVYYVVALLVGLFPWSIFLSPTCMSTAPHSKRTTRR